MFSYRIHMKGVHCYTINRRQANPYLRKPNKKTTITCRFALLTPTNDYIWPCGLMIRAGS